MMRSLWMPTGRDDTADVKEQSAYCDNVKVQNDAYHKQ